MPQVFRSMEPQDGRPKVGSGRNELGVRVPPDPKPDVRPDASGTVIAGTDEGMSVAPAIDAMYDQHIPKRLRSRFPRANGRNSLRVWTMGNGPFTDAVMTGDLRLAVTSQRHGVIAPRRDILIEELQSALAATRESWVLGE